MDGFELLAKIFPEEVNKDTEQSLDLIRLEPLGSCKSGSKSGFRVSGLRA